LLSGIDGLMVRWLDCYFANRQAIKPF